MRADDELQAENAALRDQLSWYKKAYQMMVEERNMAERLLNEYLQNRSLSVTPTAPAVAPSDTIVPPPSDDEPLICALPFPFVMPIRKSVRLSNITVSLLRGTIAPQVNGRGRKAARWCHVKRTMSEYRVIVCETTPTEFGQAIAAVVEGLNADNIRKACDDYWLPKGAVDTWPEGNRDKESMRLVTQWLWPLLVLMV